MLNVFWENDDEWHHDAWQRPFRSNEFPAWLSHRPRSTEPVPSIWTHWIFNLFLPGMQDVGSTSEVLFWWQMRKVRVPASAVVPGGVKPKLVVLTATRTFWDSGVDSVCTRRKLSSGRLVIALSWWPGWPESQSGSLISELISESQQLKSEVLAPWLYSVISSGFKNLYAEGKVRPHGFH